MILKTPVTVGRSTPPADPRSPQSDRPRPTAQTAGGGRQRTAKDLCGLRRLRCVNCTLVCHDKRGISYISST